MKWDREFVENMNKVTPLGVVTELEFNQWYDNQYHMSLRLAHNPDMELWWEELSPGYWFGKNGYFRKQFHHNPNDETGYGGATFHLKTKDRGTVALRGPWSSRPGVFMTEFGVDPYLEVEVNGTYMGVLVSVLEQVLEGSGFHLEFRLSGGESSYAVVKDGTGNE